MLMRMFFAFGATGVANLGTGVAQHCGEFAAARHCAGRQPAEGGAVDIERNAARHHFHVLFLQAGTRTNVAGIGAFIARVDTGGMAPATHRLTS